jgi:hypothetical protein
VSLEVSGFAENEVENIAGKTTTVRIGCKEGKRKRKKELPSIDYHVSVHISIQPTYIRREIFLVRNLVCGAVLVRGWRPICGILRPPCLFFTLLLATLEFPAQDESMSSATLGQMRTYCLEIISPVTGSL